MLGTLEIQQDDSQPCLLLRVDVHQRPEPPGALTKTIDEDGDRVELLREPPGAGLCPAAVEVRFLASHHPKDIARGLRKCAALLEAHAGTIRSRLGPEGGKEVRAVRLTNGELQFLS